MVLIWNFIRLSKEEHGSTMCMYFGVMPEKFLKMNFHRLAFEPTFRISENKGADQLRSYCEADISAFDFATWIVQFLYFLNPKFPASSHILCLYSSMCLRPVQKPRFSLVTAHLHIPWTCSMSQHNSHFVLHNLYTCIHFISCWYTIFIF